MTSQSSIEERWEHIKADFKSRCEAAANASPDPSKAEAIRGSLTFLDLPSPKTALKLMKYEGLAKRFEDEWKKKTR